MELSLCKSCNLAANGCSVWQSDLHVTKCNEYKSVIPRPVKYYCPSCDFSAELSEFSRIHSPCPVVKKN